MRFSHFGEIWHREGGALPQAYMYNAPGKKKLGTYTNLTWDFTSRLGGAVGIGSVVVVA